MKKYIITIGCALVAQITHASDYCDRVYREMDEARQRDAIERIERQTERIERQLKDDRDARFYDALQHNDLNSMLNNM